MDSVVVINYGAGNLASVQAALAHIGCAYRVIDHAKDMGVARCVVLPGVGDGSYMMSALGAAEFTSRLWAWAAEDKPLLGICVGAQVLLSFTHEGNSSCLDIIPGQCRSFSDALSGMGSDETDETSAKQEPYKIPHMGWNDVVPAERHKTHPLFENITQAGSPFYFVNSYYLAPDDDVHTLARTEYGISFASIIGRGNVIGTQFHPEKSGANGMTLLRNFFANVAEVL